MTACGIERISDDTHVYASVQPLPEGGWVEGDPQLFAEIFYL